MFPFLRSIHNTRT